VLFPRAAIRQSYDQRRTGPPRRVRRRDARGPIPEAEGYFTPLRFATTVDPEVDHALHRGLVVDRVGHDTEALVLEDGQEAGRVVVARPDEVEDLLERGHALHALRDPVREARVGVAAGQGPEGHRAVDDS
jgi:hypothetical protein